MEEIIMPRPKRLRKKSGEPVKDNRQEETDDELVILDDELEDAVDDEAILQSVTSKQKQKSAVATHDEAQEEDTSDVVVAKPALIERTFGPEDQHELSQNEHFRFMPPSSRIGHALVTKGKDGKIIAQQFKAPGSSDPEDPRVTELRDIEVFQDRFGGRRARAKAQDGTEMISKRSVDFETTDEHGEAVKHELLLFSPKSSHIWRGDVFWGSNPRRKPTLFRDDLDKADQKELDAEVNEAKKVVKGGELDIVHQDVPMRENMPRKPTQNDVMGKLSAIDEYRQYYEEYEDSLTPEMKEIFEKSESAREHVRTVGHKSQPRPEWCHALGHGLTPLSQDPQVATNLAAAPKWVNTQMMATERDLKWHAMNRPNTDLHLSSHFTVLPNSDIMDEGDVVGRFRENDREVKVSQHLNPHQKYPSYSKPTDIMQTTLVTNHLLTGQQAGHVSEVRIEPRMQKTYEVVTQPGGYGYTLTPVDSVAAKASASDQVNAVAKPESTSTLAPAPASSSSSSSSATASHTAVLVEAKDRQVTDSVRSSTSASSARHTAPTIDALTVSPSAPLATMATTMPTSYSQQNSVVKIFSTFQQPDYEMPWLGSTPNKCTGSGFVYKHGDKHYILSNAHVVEDSNYLEVRLANDDRKFIAKPVQVSYQADIALLEVDDPEFQAITEPVQLGEMVQLQDEVRVVGFPMGGEELSITKGIVSRIEVDTYAESGERMLQVQTDSAVNPGNSGGPVFAGNKLIGIAFQGMNEGQNLGYFIPIPMLKHFLSDVFSHDEYRGYPTLNIAVQPLANKSLLHYFGLAKGETGVRVNTIDELSDAKGKLQKDDIILAIDGIKVGNDAKVSVPEIGNRLDFNYLFHRKQIGETIQVDILRRNQASGDIERLRVPIELRYRPGQTKKVEAPEHAKDPTFYINSGIVLQPLTNNYLETRKGSALADVIIPQVGYITDIPKKIAGEQIVVVNQVLDCEQTSGYGDFENGIIDEINGRKINNIRDAVAAMEDNKEPFHRLKMLDGDLLVVKNFQQREHQQLLRQYRIHSDRSDDLAPPKPQESLMVRAAKLTEEDELGAKSKRHSSKHKSRGHQEGAKTSKKKKLMALLSELLEGDSSDEGTDDEIDKRNVQKVAKAVKKSVSSSDKKGKTRLSESQEEENLFGEDDESDVDSTLDGFIVSDDEMEADFDESGLPDELRIPHHSMLFMAQQSGQKYSMGELAYLDKIDQLAKRYGHNQGEDDLLPVSDTDSEDEASYDSGSETDTEDDEVSTPPRVVRFSKPGKRLLDDSDESDSEDDQDFAPAASSDEEKDSIPAAQPRRSRRLQGMRPA